MPSPPLVNSLEDHREYIADLDVLSRDLPATILVHGNNTTVMTTEV